MGGRGEGGTAEPISGIVKALQLDRQHAGQLTDCYSVQLTVSRGPASTRLVLSVTGCTMAFPRLLRPSANPIKLGVVFDAVLGCEASKQISKTLVVGKIVKVEAPDILVKDVELFGKANGQELLGLEFLITNDVPRLCNRFAVEAPPREVSSDEINKHIS